MRKVSPLIIGAFALMFVIGAGSAMAADWAGTGTGTFYYGEDVYHPFQTWGGSISGTTFSGMWWDTNDSGVFTCTYWGQNSYIGTWRIYSQASDAGTCTMTFLDVDTCHGGWDITLGDSIVGTPVWDGNPE